MSEFTEFLSVLMGATVATIALVYYETSEFVAIGAAGGWYGVMYALTLNKRQLSEMTEGESDT